MDLYGFLEQRPRPAAKSKSHRGRNNDGYYTGEISPSSSPSPSSPLSRPDTSNVSPISRTPSLTRTRQSSFASTRTRKSSSSSVPKSPKFPKSKSKYSYSSAVPNYLPVKPLSDDLPANTTVEVPTPKPTPKTIVKLRPRLTIVPPLPSARPVRPARPAPPRPERPVPPVPRDPRLPTPAESAEPAAASIEALPLPTADTDSDNSTTTYAKMLSRPGTAHGSIHGGALAPNQPASPSVETITYQHIQETASKRISTLDYLRKVNEGRVYWFNTYLFNKADLQRMPYFDARKLARRATNYLILGLSIPTIVDLNASSPSEFLRCLNALLAEFDAYQQIHPPDGTTSLSRARFPQMFKRTATGGKSNRRTSSAAEIGLPMGNDSGDGKQSNGSMSDSANAFPIGEGDLLPGEEYTYLLTPSLPFDPDYYETFATLCDVLIDCYTKLMGLLASPKECTPIIAEMFTKTDARMRKIIVQGVVKEFDDSSRARAKSEVAGVGKVILGGLM